MSLPQHSNNSSPIEVRGLSVRQYPHTPREHFSVGVLHVGAITAILVSTAWAADIPPIFGWKALLVAILGVACVHVLLKKWLRFSFGLWAWRLGHVQHPLLPWVVGLFVVGGTLWSGVAWTWRHPLLMAARSISISSFDPAHDNAHDVSRWSVAPFYFILGAWPSTFEGEPVFYTLPYEKGPPSKFASKIVARWHSPEVQVTFEGPRTPLLDESYGPKEIEACLKSSTWLGACTDVRRMVLERHWADIQKSIQPLRARWKLEWFEVSPSGLDRPQGWMIQGCSRTRCRTRWVLINARGSHQALVLDSKNNESGVRAIETMKKSIGSLRVGNELFSGKALADHRLSTVRLDQISPQTDAMALVAKISEVQSLLLSKISVDPANIEAYYHLAGTAVMILKKSEGIRQTAIKQQVDPRLLALSDGWSAASRTMIQSAFRYVMDINPSHKLSKRLENLWLDVSRRY